MQLNWSSQKLRPCSILVILEHLVNIDFDAGASLSSSCGEVLSFFVSRVVVVYNFSGRSLSGHESDWETKEGGGPQWPPVLVFCARAYTYSRFVPHSSVEKWHSANYKFKGGTLETWSFRSDRLVNPLLLILVILTIHILVIIA